MASGAGAGNAIGNAARLKMLSKWIGWLFAEVTRMAIIRRESVRRVLEERATAIVVTLFYLFDGEKVRLFVDYCVLYLEVVVILLFVCGMGFEVLVWSFVWCFMVIIWRLHAGNLY